MKRKFGIITNSFIELPQSNQVLAYDSQLEAWKNVPLANIEQEHEIHAGSGVVCEPNPITTVGTVSLSDTSVTPGAYTFTNLTVDAQGRITEAASGQAVTEVHAGPGLLCDPNPILTTGTVSLSDTNVTPGAYTLTNLTVDAQGRITEAASGQALTTVDEISETPDDKGVLISGLNDNTLQLCAADATHRGVLFGYTKASGGDTNTTLGYQAGPNVSSYPDGNNTVVGQGALQTYAGNIGWSDNTAVGKDALKNATNIGDATAIGAEAGASLEDDEGGTAGEGYIAIGRRAGGGTVESYPKVAYDCIYIGNNTASDSAQADSQIVLGHGTTGTNNEMTIGNYIHQVKWSGLQLHDSAATSAQYYLTCDDSNIMRRYKPPIWKAAVGTNVSIPDGVHTTVPFTASLIVDAGLNGSTGIFTCTVPGIYWAEITIGFEGNSTGIRDIRICKNDNLGQVAAFSMITPNHSNAIVFHCAGIQKLNAGDTLRVKVLQNSGDNLNVLGGGSSYFSGFWVGPN
jgi:hypothetical protein